MLTYKIHRSVSYNCSKENCINLMHRHKYCFGINLYKFNEYIYGAYMNNAHFNANVYYSYYSRCVVKDIKSKYVKSLIQCKNIQSEYLIEIYEDGVLKSDVVVMVYKLTYMNPKYVYVVDAVVNGVGWPPMIPEEYKKECTYVEYPEPYIPTEITDDNITLRDNVIYMNNKPLDDLGYYQNKDDMYKIDGDVCEVHLPFNIIHIKDIPEDIKKYKLKFINDNVKLEGHCKLCILNYDNKIQELNILNDNILVNNGNDGRLFDEVISFKQTI